MSGLIDDQLYQVDVKELEDAIDESIKTHLSKFMQTFPMVASTLKE
jgi:hypothetical protein